MHTAEQPDADVRGDLNPAAPRRTWLWLGPLVFIAAIVAATAILTPQVFRDDPCDSAVPYATELDVSLSDSEQVVSCTWTARFRDSSGTVVVRTESAATRELLLQRSGVTEAAGLAATPTGTGPPEESAHQPNAERSEHVYSATSPGRHLLRITYDDAVESGLLLTISVIEL